MNSKLGIGLLLVVGFALASPAQAQYIGFTTGLTPAQVPYAVQPSPYAIVAPSIYNTQILVPQGTVNRPGYAPLPPLPLIIIQQPGPQWNHGQYYAPPYQPRPTWAPSTVEYQRTVPQVSPVPAPAPAPTAPASAQPAPGTPRQNVISQLGQPSMSILTSAGETMYFKGGVTVVLQNGQVAQPK